MPTAATGTVYAIGRNYAEHAKELGSAIPQEPVVFLKPASSLCESGSTIILPTQSQRVDHEVEVVLRIGTQSKNLTEANALMALSHYAVGIDVTARDLQEQAKKKALPWAVCKGFDTFAPVSEWVPVAQISNPMDLHFGLEVNGQERQNGHTADMLFSIPRLLVYLSGIFTLRPGDLIFTGTPLGVSPLKPGDEVRAYLGKSDTPLVELKVGVSGAR